MTTFMKKGSDFLQERLSMFVKSWTMQQEMARGFLCIKSAKSAGTGGREIFTMGLFGQFRDS